MCDFVDSYHFWLALLTETFALCFFKLLYLRCGRLFRLNEKHLRSLQLVLGLRRCLRWRRSNHIYVRRFLGCTRLVELLTKLLPFVYANNGIILDSLDELQEIWPD